MWSLIWDVIFLCFGIYDQYPNPRVWINFVSEPRLVGNWLAWDRIPNRCSKERAIDTEDFVLGYVGAIAWCDGEGLDCQIMFNIDLYKSCLDLIIRWLDLWYSHWFVIKLCGLLSNCGRFEVSILDPFVLLSIYSNLWWIWLYSVDTTGGINPILIGFRLYCDESLISILDSIRSLCSPLFFIMINSWICLILHVPLISVYLCDDSLWFDVILNDRPHTSLNPLGQTQDEAQPAETLSALFLQGQELSGPRLCWSNF